MIRILSLFAVVFLAFTGIADATQVRAIYKLYSPTGAFDGFGVVTSIAALDGRDRIIEMRRADLPANVRNGTPGEIEAYVNNFLDTTLAGYPTKCRVRVWTSSPLNMDAICSDRPIPADAFDNTER